MIIIDGNSLMYRAYYGMKADTKNSKGLPTNAIYGFVRMINNLISSEYDNILVAFDAGKKTIRHELMEDYKAGRSPMPPEFKQQIPYIKHYLELMRIKQYEQDLYEADDIIGTMSRLAEESGYHVDIYSSDKYLLSAFRHCSEYRAFRVHKCEHKSSHLWMKAIVTVPMERLFMRLTINR